MKKSQFFTIRTSKVIEKAHHFFSIFGKIFFNIFLKINPFNVKYSFFGIVNSVLVSTYKSNLPACHQSIEDIFEDKVGKKSN